MGVFSKLFKWVMSLLKKLWDLVKKIVPIVLLGLSLVCAFMGDWPLAMLFAGASLLLFPRETSEVATKVVKSVGSVASTATAVLGSAVGSGVSSLFSSSGLSVLLVASLGFGAFLLTRRRRDDGGGGPATGESSSEEVVA